MPFLTSDRPERAAGTRVRCPPRRARRDAPSVRRCALVATATILAAAGCASAGARPTPAQLRPLPPAPGLGLAGQRVIVLPLSAVRGGDALGWAASIPDLRGYLLDVNARIAHTLADRAGRTSWILPSELARIAARNPGYAPDPYAADPSQFWPDRWRGDTKLLDPLAGDLRTMTSFVDARVALVPVELRFIPREDGHTAAAVSSGGPTATPPGEGRAVLRLALVDTRAMVVFWVGDLVGDPAPALTPAVAANLADRLAAVMSTQ